MRVDFSEMGFIGCKKNNKTPILEKSARVALLVTPIKPAIKASLPPSWHDIYSAFEGCYLRDAVSYTHLRAHET